MTSFSIMGISITPSDGTGTPTVTALNKTNGITFRLLYAAARESAINKQKNMLH